MRCPNSKAIQKNISIQLNDSMMEQEKHGLEAFYCILTHEVMSDPVLLVGTGDT